jgi:hypothetical protein
MKIDRSVALLVLSAAGSLAAISACEVIVDEPAKHPAPPPPPTAAQAAPAAPPKEPKVVTMHLHEPGAAPAGGGAAPPAAACLDTGAATVGNCAAMQAGTCTAAPTPQQRCNAYKTYYAPKVAAAAVSCLTALTSAQVCDPTQVAACGRAALAQACAVPAAAQLCQVAAGPCKTSAADCTSAISGLDSEGQQAVAQCVARGCSAGLSACLDGLASASSAVSSAH